MSTSHAIDAGSPDAASRGANRLDSRFVGFRRSRGQGMRDRLIEDHQWLATHCARRYAGRGEPAEDLVQVALLGLVKAVERFDADRGFAFSTFAVPTILGELRRYFRDAGWAAHVPRRVKDTYLTAVKTAEALQHDLGRSPTRQELASCLDIGVGDLLEATSAAASYWTRSLNPSGDEADALDLDVLLAYDDPSFGEADTRETVERLLRVLPRRERRVVELRFFAELSQGEIAARIGISQVHVSRLLKASVERLRRELQAMDGRVAACA